MAGESTELFRISRKRQRGDTIRADPGGKNMSCLPPMAGNGFYIAPQKMVMTGGWFIIVHIIGDVYPIISP